LFGGGNDQLPSLIQCARRQWPILLISTQADDLADRIWKANLAANPKDGTPPKTDADPSIAEIVETANIGQVPLDGPIDPFQKNVGAHLENRVNTLADAWSRYDDLDRAAIKKQTIFKLVQGAILLLGLAATLLAILQSHAELPAWYKRYFAE